MNKMRMRLGRWAAALAVAALAAGSGFLAAGPASAASTTSYNPIRNAGPNQLCLDVMSEDGLQNDGARLQLYHCTGVSEQKFILVQADTGEGPVPGYYEIRPASSPGKCLVPSTTTSAWDTPLNPGAFLGAQVVQKTCAFYAQIQNWKFKSTSEIVNQYYGDSAAWTPGATARLITSVSCSGCAAATSSSAGSPRALPGGERPRALPAARPNSSDEGGPERAVIT